MLSCKLLQGQAVKQPALTVTHQVPCAGGIEMLLLTPSSCAGIVKYTRARTQTRAHTHTRTHARAYLHERLHTNAHTLHAKKRMHTNLRGPKSLPTPCSAASPAMCAAPAQEHLQAGMPPSGRILDAPAPQLCLFLIDVHIHGPMHSKSTCLRVHPSPFLDC